MSGSRFRLAIESRLIHTKTRSLNQAPSVRSSSARRLLCPIQNTRLCDCKNYFQHCPPPIGVHVVKVWNHAVCSTQDAPLLHASFATRHQRLLSLLVAKSIGCYSSQDLSAVLSRVPVPTRYGHGCRGYNLFSRPHRRGHDSIPILAAVPRQPDLNETSTRRHCRGVEFNVFISQSINLIYGGTSPSFCCRGGCTIGKGVISWIIHHDIRVDLVQDLLCSCGGILYLNEAMVLRRGRLEKLARLAKIVNLSRISQTGGGNWPRRP